MTIPRILILLVLLLVAAGAVAVFALDNAPPTSRVEKVIADDRFQR